jgi:hypothetical protein
MEASKFKCSQLEKGCSLCPLLGECKNPLNTIKSKGKKHSFHIYHKKEDMGMVERREYVFSI